MIIIIGSGHARACPHMHMIRGIHADMQRQKIKRDGKGEKAYAAEQPCRTSISLGGAWGALGRAFKLHMRDIDRASEVALCFLFQAVSCVLCMCV